MPNSIAAVRTGGHIALIGVLAGLSGEISTATMMVRQIRLQGLIVGSRRHQIEFIRGLEGLGIRPVIDRRYPLAELADAFRRQATGAHFGKIAVAV